MKQKTCNVDHACCPSPLQLTSYLAGSGRSDVYKTVAITQPRKRSALVSTRPLSVPALLSRQGQHFIHTWDDLADGLLRKDSASRWRKAQLCDLQAG